MQIHQKPFIILDRDGVINYDSPHYIKSPEEWIAIPGSLEAIAHLNRHGFHVLIASNQSGIGRGLYDLETLSLIHEKLMYELQALGGYVEEIFICPHTPQDHCLCRKPKPGLLHQMQKKYGFQFTDTFFIGDSYGDLLAAQAVQCKPILVETGKGKETLNSINDKSIPHFINLHEAVNYVISFYHSKNNVSIA